MKMYDLAPKLNLDFQYLTDGALMVKSMLANLVTLK